MFGHARKLIFASGLGDANGHMVPVQCGVDVDMEGNVAQILHSIQKACQLQHTM